MKIFKLIIILMGIFLFTSACGETGEISVQDVWARPGFIGDNSAVYLRINNTNPNGDGLIGASTDIAGMTEIHLSKMDDAGIMTMERQDLIEIPSNGFVELAPGGLHVMLMNLSKDLSPGDTFQLTLEFERAGDITVEVEVRKP